MISYIFKNKIKNILVTVFSALILCISLNELYEYIVYGTPNSVLLKFIDTIPYILIFLYMITLKREYKIKQFLFPIAFATLTLTAVFSIINCFDEYTFSSLNGLFRLFINLIIKFVLIAGYSLSFVGSLSNFKRIILLRIGLLICIITIIIQGVSYNYLVEWIGNTFYSYIYYIDEVCKAISLLLFYISVFVLSLTKKSENIDITPFVEARKNKKAYKKAAKIEREKPELFTPPVVPKGHWRCMGCGEILPNDKNECNCGYKR